MDQSSDKKNSEEGGNGYAARTTDAATPPATSTENVAEEAPPATATENVADASEEWSRWQAHTDLLGRTCAKRDRELRVGHFDVQLRYFSKFEAYSPLDAIKNLHSYELLTPRSFSSSEKASETTAEELRQKVKFIVATDQELMDYLTSHSESDDESECYSDETEDEEDEEAEEAEEAAENDVGESGNKNTATTTKISPKNIIKATSISTKNIRATRASEKTANRDNKSRICNENDVAVYKALCANFGFIRCVPAYLYVSYDGDEEVMCRCRIMFEKPLEGVPAGSTIGYINKIPLKVVPLKVKESAEQDINSSRRVGFSEVLFRAPLALRKSQLPRSFIPNKGGFKNPCPKTGKMVHITTITRL